MAKSKSHKTRRHSSFHKKKSFFSSSMAIFLAAFVLIGGIVIWRIFAASNSGILEAEKMKHYSKVIKFAEEDASGGRAIKVNSYEKSASKRRLTGTLVTGNAKSYSFIVAARANPCSNKYGGAWPKFTARLSGPVNATMSHTVKYRGWHYYTLNGLSAPGKKKYNVDIRYTTVVPYSHKKTCRTFLYFDVIKLKPQAVTITKVASKVDDAKGVTISARLNGHGNNVSWYVEYGPSTDYGYVSELKSIKNLTLKDVSVLVNKGLVPGTTFHYRVCATNFDAVNCSDDFTFTTGDKVSKDTSKGTKCKFHGGTSTDNHTPPNPRKCAPRPHNE